MKTTSYKYIVTIETRAWNNSIDQAIEDKSTFIQLEFSNTNPLIAREEALKKAKSVLEFFEDENEDHILPPLKWTEDFIDDAPQIFMYYQIKVELEMTDKEYCIYDTGGPSNDMGEVLNGLMKEFEILQKSGISLKKNVQEVKYFDHKDKKNKKTTILKNGMDLSNLEINIIHSFDISLLDDKKKTSKQKANKNSTKQKLGQEITFQSTYKNRFAIKRQNLEITLRSSMQTISADLEKDINALIKKWMTKK